MVIEKTALTDRQARFIDEYLANGGNGAQAAISAGYSAKAARVTASRMLTNANVVSKISEAQAEIKDRLGVTAEWKRARLRQIIDACTQTVDVSTGVVSMIEPKAAISAIAELNRMDGDLATIKTDTRLTGELGTRTTVVIKNLTGRTS